MNTTLSKRLTDIENAIMPEKAYAYLQYFDWQQTEQEAIDEWNAKHNANYTIDDFDNVTVITYAKTINPEG